MDQDIYRPPVAEVVYEDTKGKQFYVVDPAKFTILFFATVGLYYVFWFYKQWKCYKAYHQRSLWPVSRALFNIFYTHSLFRRISETLREKGIDYSFNNGVLATWYVLITIVSSVIEHLTIRGNFAVVSIGSTLISLFAVYAILMKAQRAINIAEEDAEGECNSVLTFGNYVWIVIGLIMWLGLVSEYLVELGVIR